MISWYLLIADVAPQANNRTANFQYCVKITNLDKYPTYQLLAQVGEQIGATDLQTGAAIYQIVTNTCIPISHIHNVAYITAIEKNKIKQNDPNSTNSSQISIDPNSQKRLSKGTHLLHPRITSIGGEGKLIQGSYEIKSIARDDFKLIKVDESIVVHDVKSIPVDKSSDLHNVRSLPVDESKQLLNPLNILVFLAISIAILSWRILKRKSKKFGK